MRSTVIVPGPDTAFGKCDCAFKKPVPKSLINSDQHREWQVDHEQPRCSFRRVPGADYGEPRAAVLEPAGFRPHLNIGRPGFESGAMTFSFNGRLSAAAIAAGTGPPSPHG